MQTGSSAYNISVRCEDIVTFLCLSLSYIKEVFNLPVLVALNQIGVGKGRGLISSVNESILSLKSIKINCCFYSSVCSTFPCFKKKLS